MQCNLIAWKAKNKRFRNQQQQNYSLIISHHRCQWRHFRKSINTEFDFPKYQNKIFQFFFYHNPILLLWSDWVKWQKNKINKTKYVLLLHIRCPSTCLVLNGFCFYFIFVSSVLTHSIISFECIIKS